MNDAFEVLHLPRLEQTWIAGLEIGRPAVSRVLVGSLDRDQDARAARQGDGLAAGALGKCRVALKSHVNSGGRAVVELDRDAVIAGMRACADRIDLGHRRRCW